MTYHSFEDWLLKFELAMNAHKAPMSGDEQIASHKALMELSKSINSAWTYCIEHATLAEYFLDKLIFNRHPNLFFRLQSRWFKNEYDKRSDALIYTGEILELNPSSSPAIDESTEI